MTTPDAFWNYQIAIPADVKRPDDPDTVSAAELLLYANRAAWLDNDALKTLATTLATVDADVKAQPTGAQVDIPALATQLATPLANAVKPLLPTDTTPAQLFTALAAQLTK